MKIKCIYRTKTRHIDHQLKKDLSVVSLMTLIPSSVKTYLSEILRVKNACDDGDKAGKRMKRTREKKQQHLKAKGKEKEKEGGRDRI